MAWLVTGGAGYIGAHVAACLSAAGEPVVVLDDLSSGDAGRVEGLPAVRGDVLDSALLRETLREHRIRGVIHLAAKKDVQTSFDRPLEYYRYNVEGLRRVLEAATDGGVECFVFSSSAAVYGTPDVEVVDEDLACTPVSPYGGTKLIGEQMLTDVSRATGLRFVALRYFNVAGAARRALADRRTDNLVPRVVQRLSQRLPPHTLGDDY